jgi:hypothetical protein
MAYNKPATGPDALYIGDGTAVHPLVSHTRQVEITGDQTITGEKTIDVDDLKITGGTNGHLLSTNGSGGLSWVGAPPASVIVHSPSALSGNGLTATPLTLTVATAAEVTAGTDDLHPVTALRVRGLTGADVATLHTTIKTIVPAINEVYDEIKALESPLQLMGTYNASTHQIHPTVGVPAALPAAHLTNKGHVFIVDTAGTGAAPAPVVAMSVSDWLFSDGVTWHHLAMHLPATTAAAVSVAAITGMTATNVQGALAEVFAGLPVHVNTATLSGNGTTATPLNVIGVDDGTY